MLGAFSRATGLVELESLLEAIKVVFPTFADVNIKAAKLGYERVDVKEYTG
jgi:Pyruvate/2-oxoacid:ferredoxin oxidoreductase gamma subunit